MRRLVINGIYWALGRDVPAGGAERGGRRHRTSRRPTFDLSEGRSKGALAARAGRGRLARYGASPR